MARTTLFTMTVSSMTAAILMAPEANRKTLRIAQGFNAAIAGAACGGFHNGDGANILAVLPRLMDKKIHMRLEKPAGSKLENSLWPWPSRRALRKWPMQKPGPQTIEGIVRAQLNNWTYP